MKKGILKDLFVVLAGYFVFAYLISSNWGTFKYLPTFVVIGALGVFFILGGLLHNKKTKVGVIVAIVTPHMIADLFYVLGLQFKNSFFIELFRQVVPHVQSSMKLVEQIGLRDTLPSTRIAIATIMMIPLSYLAMVLGSKLRVSIKSSGKWVYNNILVWVVHFILFVVFTNVVTTFPSILKDEKTALMFAFLSTSILFVVYFFTGRGCLTIKNPIGQFTSMISVTATSLMLYIGTLLLFMNSGIFERYILPVATSFIGIICKKIGIMTGASAEIISRYGILATILMILAPVIIVYIGKVASLPDEKEVKEPLEGLNQEKIVSEN